MYLKVAVSELCSLAYFANIVLKTLCLTYLPLLVFLFYSSCLNDNKICHFNSILTFTCSSQHCSCNQEYSVLRLASSPDKGSLLYTLLLTQAVYTQHFEPFFSGVYFTI